MNAGRKGIAYLRDVYPPDITPSDAVARTDRDGDRALAAATFEVGAEN